MKRSFAIVPIREFHDTKIRLSPVLTDRERALLTEILLRGVLRALINSRLSGIVVVASDPKEVLDRFGKLPKLEIISESRNHGGVNRAMTDGLNHFKEEENSSRVLLPSDLPMLSHKTVDRILSMLDDFDLVINPSGRRDGTNLLSFRSNKGITLHYDNNSYNNHIIEAQKYELNFATIEWEDVSFDIDDRNDLDRLFNYYNVRTCEELNRAVLRLDK